METNGALVNLLKTLFSVLINILGGSILSIENVISYHEFGRYGGYGEHSWGYGVRNLKFHTPDPNEGVETWIRLQEGETRARVVLDDQYGR